MFKKFDVKEINGNTEKLFVERYAERTMVTGNTRLSNYTAWRVISVGVMSVNKVKKNWRTRTINEQRRSVHVHLPYRRRAPVRVLEPYQTIREIDGRPVSIQRELV